MADEILYEVRDRIAIVTINRPHRRNALSWSALALFRETMRRATEDDQVLAVVITGAGGAFCAGTDLVDLTQTKSDQRGGSDTGNNWMVQSCPKPVVAAIDGPAVGLGAEIATQADVRIASDRMRIAWNFVKRGLVPDTRAASYLLPRQSV
ncbi:MAG: enoyl-CoA hydratase/isomerase family protein [Antricoccus sp.]